MLMQQQANTALLQTRSALASPSCAEVLTVGTLTLMPQGCSHFVTVQLMDMLVEQTHELRYEWRNNERPLRFTDIRVDEQARGISLKSTPMSLVLEASSGKSFVMNMLDTPGALLAPVYAGFVLKHVMLPRAHSLHATVGLSLLSVHDLSGEVAEWSQSSFAVHACARHTCYCQLQSVQQSFPRALNNCPVTSNGSSPDSAALCLIKSQENATAQDGFLTLRLCWMSRR